MLRALFLLFCLSSAAVAFIHTQSVLLRHAPGSTRNPACTFQHVHVGRVAALMMSAATLDTQLLETKEEKSSSSGVLSLQQKIQSLGSEKKWQEALDALHSADGPLSTIMYNVAISAMAKNFRREEACRLFDEMSQNSITKDLYTYSSIASALKSGGESQKLTELLSELESSGLKLDVATYNSFLDSFAANGQPGKCISLIRRMIANDIPPETISFNYVLTSFGKAKNWPGVLQTLAEMEERGVARNVFTYVAIFEAAARTADEKDILSYWEQMMEEKIKPTSKLYRIAVEAFIKTKNCAKAVELLELMEQDGKTLAGSLVSDVMDACTAAGQGEKAIALFSKLPPTPAIYNSLILAYSKLQKYNKAIEYYAAMIEKDFKPKPLVLESVILACTNLGRVEKAVQVLEDMKARGSKPGQRTYNNIINSANKRGKPKVAVAMLEEMISGGIYTRPSIRTFNTVLGSLAKARQTDKAVKIFDEDMKQKDIVSYNTIISACAKGAKVDLAEKYFEECKSAGFTPTLVTWNSLLDAHNKASNYEKAITCLELMRIQSVEPNVISYNTCMAACKNAKRLDKALELAADMEKRGIEMTGVTKLILGEARKTKVPEIKEPEE